MAAACTVEEAVAALRRGGVIAYPTEAVWGLGCDPRDEAATLRLLLVAADEAQLAPFIDMDVLDAAQRDAVRASWPGPHTWIVPASAGAPRWITGAHNGIAVRVSAHPTVIALCNAFGSALVSTSANRAGAPAARSVAELDTRIVAAVDAVAAGETGGLLRPTDIRDARTGSVLRL